MSKILVTGGLGFIGSHTVVELLNNNYEVIIIDNLSNASKSVLEGIRNITGKTPELHVFDLIDQTKVLDFFKNNADISGIIHFAAYKAVGESVLFPIKYYENNLFSLVNILKAASQFNLYFNFIFSSSCTVYGQAETQPVDENTPSQKAESPYGNTKQICEEILRDYTISSDNLNIISLRYFNPIGAHPTSEIGELPLGKPNCLVPYLTQSVAGVLGQLTVFGNDYNTHDGTCLRDYIDVIDLSKAHVAALKKLENDNNNPKYDVFNLGTGNGTSVLEVLQTFEKATGEKVNYQIGPRRSGDVESIYARTDKAFEVLNWKATTPLSESLNNAWKWEKKIRGIVEPEPTR